MIRFSLIFFLSIFTLKVVASTPALDQLIQDIKKQGPDFVLLIDDDPTDRHWVLPKGLEQALSTHDIQVSLRSQQCQPLDNDKALGDLLAALAIKFNPKSKLFQKASKEFQGQIPQRDDNELCVMELDIQGPFCGLYGSYAYIYNYGLNAPLLAIATTEDVFWCE